MSSHRQVEVDTVNPQMDVRQRLDMGPPIGEGAMCVVREATDRNLLRRGAAKLLHPELARDLNTRRRMIEEAQITAQLDHPNILPVYELGETPEGELYFTMKLVEGRTLAEVLGQTETDERVDEVLLDLMQVYVKVCDALAFAHSRGVVHRDLKPDNIMVGEFGEVYLMDWGIAKLRSQLRPGAEQRPELARTPDGRQRLASQDGKYVGTPYYMSPEQARGDHPATDERSDVFAMGAILYEILTDEPPFDGASLMDVLRAAADGAVTPPQEVVDHPLPPRLCQVAMRAMARDPALRYASVRELKDDVMRFLRSGWHFPLVTVEPGAPVVTEGEAGDSAYIIVKGTCRVTKAADGKEVTLAELGPGDVFGETAVFTDEPRGATVRAVERATLRVVPRAFFNEDLASGQALGLFVRAVARRFNERNRRALELEMDLERAELITRVQRYLMFAGRAAPDGRREAAWSSLRDILTTQLRRTEAQLIDLLEQEPTLEVDPVRNTVTVSRM